MAAQAFLSATGEASEGILLAENPPYLSPCPLHDLDPVAGNTGDSLLLLSQPLSQLRSRRVRNKQDRFHLQYVVVFICFRIFSGFKIFLDFVFIFIFIPAGFPKHFLPVSGSQRVLCTPVEGELSFLSIPDF